MTFWKVKAARVGFSTVGDPKAATKARQTTLKAKQCMQKQKKKAATTTGKAQTTSRSNSCTNSSTNQTAATQQHKQNKQQKHFGRSKAGKD